MLIINTKFQLIDFYLLDNLDKYAGVEIIYKYNIQCTNFIRFIHYRMLYSLQHTNKQVKNTFTKKHIC